MNVDRYEKIWMWGVGAMLALFFATTAVGALLQQIHPPSHVETIDPRTAMRDARFRTPGVSMDGEGRVVVTLVAVMYAWLPAEFTVPAGTPITFRLTSVDVTHGFQIVRTNGQAMTLPGYVSQFTTTFTEPGEYLIACNEYCGVGHHAMAGKMHVVPADAWQPPTTTTAEATHDHAR